ncbi:MAG: DUF389 domain-containing protein [Waterburya sp.]
MNEFFRFLKSLLQIPLFRRIWVLWKALTASWRIYLEKPLSVKELTDSREAASIPSFGFFFLLISATVIATFGLLLDSTAVIIGAMIIAPLMNPILSISFATVTGNRKLHQRSVITVILGCFCSILVSYLITTLVGLEVADSEILGRTSPNLLDLGIAIAAGAAGSFSLTRKSIASSIAGVAIAVALVPPLCVVGIGIGMGDELTVQVGHIVVNSIDVSSGAFLLFMANLGGITIAASIVFLSQSYGSLRKALNLTLIWVLMVALLCAPLNNALKKFLIKSRIQADIKIIRSEHLEISQKSQIRYINVQVKGTKVYIQVMTFAPKSLITDEYIETMRKRLFDSLSKMGIQSIEVVIQIVPIEIEEYRFIYK